MNTLTIRNDIFPLKIRSQLFAGVLVAFIYLLLPIYIYPSGSLQLVDPFICLAIALALFKGIKTNYFNKQLFFFLPFIVWGVMVNLIYFMFDPGDMTFLKKSAELVYLFLQTYAFMVIFTNFVVHNQAKYFYIAILLCLFPPFLIKGNYDESGLRMALSFNNPNQLGYFGILLMSFIILLRNYYTINSEILLGKIAKIIIGLGIMLAHIFAFLSVSKASIACLLILDAFYLKNISLKTIGYFASLLIISIFILLTIKPDYIDKFQTYCAARGNLESVTNRMEKQYDRLIFQRDWQVIVGIGSGSVEKNIDDKEVHNTLASMFHSYGMIGLFLLIIWFLRIIRLSRMLDGGLFVSCAIAFYNFFHNGSRFRFAYIVFAFIIVLACLMQEKRKSDNSNSRIKSLKPATLPNGVLTSKRR